MWIFFIVLFGLQANAGGHIPMATLLITSLVVISVSEQNLFNDGVIIILECIKHSINLKY